jgi:metal-sulfur cluster biosynthetic enzyme
MNQPSTATGARIEQALREVIDPELGVNIVDLGLIYSVDLQGQLARVTMTLTTPGCPMHESIAEGVRIALLQLEEIEEAEVKVVWDPPWNASMMTDAGREHMSMR